ncbi:XRE family transcriptional regulator [Terasakiella sp. A23]|uniref:XRE family transcriptional regulator n=1 Tax=Terasakiella sp. FCG-A23 TaxID=3080561 RepID=UPI002954E5EB|nr:XRE family transcriptional regulator [Terasakiella sp. A23]MDV7340447.1 XRE family transcriptional regulator [Terasakiella sp. A23]
MTDSFQSRLKELAKECGGNRALCEQSGISERTFANWLSGSSEPKIIGISAIANAAGVTIDWIVSGAKPKLLLGSRRHSDEDTVKIPLISPTLKTSSRQPLQRLVVNDHVPFSASFLNKRLHREDHDQLCILEISGDAMEPTARDGDFVLVDRSKTALTDGLMAFIFKDVISIKRVIQTLDGLEIVSDNKSLYPPHTIPIKEMHHLAIIGHVIWIGKTVL